MLCIAKQNLSIGVNVVSKGSPSLILSVLRISLGITIRPKSSTLLTMPVAFIYLSPFLRRIRPPCVKGAGRNLWFLTGGLSCVDMLQSLRHGLRRATPRPLLSASQTFSPLTGKSALCTREALVPTIILQITLLVSVKERRLYRNQKKNSFAYCKGVLPHYFNFSIQLYWPL